MQIIVVVVVVVVVWFLCAQYNYMTPDQVSLAREQLYALLRKVRQEAVPLVDAFDFSDRTLCSTLGRYDGDVYRALLDWAKRAPRNKHKVSHVMK